MMVQADVVHKQPVSICIHWEPSFPLSLYVIYIYIYVDMFVLNESMCIQEMFSFPLTTQTHGPTHTHLGISYITATHRKLCSIHLPRLQVYVCVCDFCHFIFHMFFFPEPSHVLKTHPFSVPVLLTFAASPSTLPLSAEECCCGWSIM